MGELSLDLKPNLYKPPSINLFLREVERIGNVSEKLDKVDGYVRCLEAEIKKIEGFKKELPLCMLLLNDAIGTLRCETMQWKSSDVGPVMEKIVPLKENNDLWDKKSWMSSVQLWTSSNGYSKTDEKKQKSVEEMRNEEKGSVVSNENIFPRNGGGAFVPFKGFSGFLSIAKIEEKEKDVQVESGLSLLTPPIKKPRGVETSVCLMNQKSCGGNRAIPNTSTENSQSSLHVPLHQQAPRKQRRCWSPDLHKRFLKALNELGGSQVATPKQIRELMKVDGLTNDEVKSHLQKYRLHTRRYPGSANALASENQKLVLFGGLWVPQDESGTSKASTSDSPQGPLQLMGTSVGTSTTGGDTMDDDDEEEEEDAKSESYNWKGQF
ncbi:hypothetical protein ACHQM5_023434 [Ranunculus cassubicifolius]